MRNISARRRAATTTLVGTAAMALILSSGPAQAAPSDPSPKVDPAPAAAPATGEVKAKKRDNLGSHDRELLAEARDKGQKRISVMLATDRKATASVVSSLKAQGAWIGTVDDKLGYVRASVPTTKVEKVAALSRVAAADVDETIPLEDPKQGKASTAGSVTAAGPGASTADSNPYMPTRETGSVAFKAKYPTYDGRGVTIGVIDSGVDLDHPALQKTTTGQRKIVDWVTGTDPVLDDDATWRPMLSEVSGPTFTYQGAEWTAPDDGDYLVNRFSESITKGSEPGGDVNRDGDTTDVFGVLYDPETNDIWVDSDQDRTFTADEKMRPYKENFDVGHFGTDDESTDVVESMPFTVEFRKDVSLAPYGLDGTADFVNIGIVEDAHGSHVAGIAAGNSLFGGAVDGQAPGAKIVSTRACTWGGGCTAAALLDGMVDLVKNRKVDVVNMSIGGLPALNDANNARATIYDRLIDDTGVQLFISAGNSGPGTNTIGDPSVANKVMSVASSISKDTWRSNYGSSVSTALNLHPFSSRGPTEAGDFKPNIAAPGSAVSTVPRWLKQADLAEAGYTLPIGYAMFNGTSMASPQAAGSAALLLSGTYARKIPTTSKQLRDAISSSAKRIPNVPTIGQGAGVVDVPGAFHLLNTTTNRAAEWTTDAPVCSPLSEFLKTPNRGLGVYNRCTASEGGHTIGRTKTYAVKVTKTSGTTASRRHTVRIVGNDGTFSAPTSVVIGGGKASTISVKATTKSAGVHSAILEIDNPSTSVVDHRVMLTVVQSQDLAAPSFSKNITGTATRNATKSYFVTVPEGAKALQVNLSRIATSSQTRFIAINPYGVPVDSTATVDCYTNYSDAKTCNPLSRAYTDPLPGVWEIELESRRTSPFLDNPFSLTAAVQGVTIDPAKQTIESATPGEPAPVSWKVTNPYGPTQVTTKGGALGSAVSKRRTIADGASQSYEVTVPEGASELTATIGNPSDVGSDLDLAIEDADGEVVGTSADGDSEESVTLKAPAPGTYTVVVDGYAVPSGSTEYDYLDVFTSSALGTLDVPSTPVDLDRNESTEVEGSLTAKTAAGEGRQLFGRLSVLSEEGAVLGTADVIVGSVTDGDAAQ